MTYLLKTIIWNTESKITYIREECMWISFGTEISFVNGYVSFDKIIRHFFTHRIRQYFNFYFLQISWFYKILIYITPTGKYDVIIDQIIIFFE